MSASVPEEWREFDLLCRNRDHGDHCIYLGTFPFAPTTPGNFVSDGEPVVVLVEMYGRCTWDHGSYMTREFHVYDPVFCKPHS